MESRRVDEDGGAVALVVKSQLAEAKVEADCRADFADDGVEWGGDFFTELDAVGLLHRRAVSLVHVEEVELLVALGDLAILVDPDLGVLDLLGVGVVAGLVNTDRDGERVLLGRFLESKDNNGLVDRCTKLERLFRTMAEVVSSLWQEDSLDRW